VQDLKEKIDGEEDELDRDERSLAQGNLREEMSFELKMSTEEKTKKELSRINHKRRGR